MTLSKEFIIAAIGLAILAIAVIRGFKVTSKQKGEKSDGSTSTTTTTTTTTTENKG